MRVGFVHTVPALAGSFDADLAQRRPDATAVHVADASLLAQAIATGTDAGVDAALAAHVRHLADQGAVAVLVTCSSIGEATRRVAHDAPVPVVRIDEAMAAEAVERAAGGHIAVLATLDATVGPTARLLTDAASRVTVMPRVTATVVQGAAQARAAGDLATHDALIAAAVRVTDAPVVVLAQASMAQAASAAAGDAVVLTSPHSGLTRLIATAEELL